MKILFIVIEWMISAGIALLYYKSSIQKLRNPYAFIQIVEDYQAFPVRATSILAPMLSVVELITSIWIILPWTRVLGATVGSALQVVFIILIMNNMGKSFNNGCGCFRINSPTKITPVHVLMNIGILLLLLTVMVISFMNGGL